MTVTEIGLLKLKPMVTIDGVPELQVRMTEITKGLQEFTGHNFHFLQQVEDPSFVYLLGEWESIAQHNEVFHATKVFQNALPIMSNFIDFQWQCHFDFLLADVQLDAPVLWLEMHVVKNGKRERTLRNASERTGNFLMHS